MKRLARLLGLTLLLVTFAAPAAPKAAPYRPKIYLGGPDVFHANPAAIAAEKKKLCEKYGFEGLFPLDNEVKPAATPAETGLTIFRVNVDLMRRSDLMIANMTPFRGPSMDVGTAFEMGYMMGRGKPVLAYTDDARGFAERTTAYVKARGGRVDDKNGHLRDSDGLALENFGLADNLMLEGAVRRSDARVEKTFEDALKHNAERLHALFRARLQVRDVAK